MHSHSRIQKILFLNGHGSNEFVIAAMRPKLAAEEGVLSTIGYTWWNLPSASEEMKSISEADKGSIGHAGELETSMQLYLQPELVDMATAVWARGVNGDPSFGTREKGERLIGAATDALVDMLRDYHSGKLEDSMVRGKKVFVGRKTVDSIDALVRPS